MLLVDEYSNWSITHGKLYLWAKRLIRMIKHKFMKEILLIRIDENFNLNEVRTDEKNHAIEPYSW